MWVRPDAGFSSSSVELCRVKASCTNSPSLAGCVEQPGVAIRRNLVMKVFYQRLGGKCKAYKVALVAVMRKPRETLVRLYPTRDHSTDLRKTHQAGSGKKFVSKAAFRQDLWVNGSPCHSAAERSG